MCGIIGYLGKREAVGIITEGLQRLEYRGYDSAGVALLDDAGELQIRRSEGKLSRLTELLEKTPITGTIGIGHTRWATHGRPSEENAHPHRNGDTVVVHNGIIENYLELKKSFSFDEHGYVSDTDSEVIAHLVEHYVNETGDFQEGVRKALLKLKGSFAVVILNKKFPDQIIAARYESPLVLGVGDDECFVASDIPAFLPYTRNVVFLYDGEMVVIKDGAPQYFTFDLQPVEKKMETIRWSPVMAERAGYNHFMQKEIFEQPRAIIDTFRTRIMAEDGEIFLDGLEQWADDAAAIQRMIIVACGTSFHAGLVGKFLIEDVARIPVDVDLGSEFRYRDPIIQPNTLMTCISQSGETADTMAALREGKRQHARTVAICNVVGSSIVREADGVVYTHAGPEIGVASTKAFTTQLTVLYLMALFLAQAKKIIKKEDSLTAIADLIRVPHQVEEVLAADSHIVDIAKKYCQASDFLYLGRGINYPVALEGALKLKEISYIHAEGYPAGEMKHGPIALIDESLPVVALVTEGITYSKMLSNMEQVKSRGGKVIAVTTILNKDVEALADDVITVPRTQERLSPIVLTVPLQLLAYHIAVLRGTDVDQPRNLAKSVTVE
jgi:glutamine---fructose-6-phosphate transaminase (isomerizing)